MSSPEFRFLFLRMLRFRTLFRNTNGLQNNLQINLSLLKLISETALILSYASYQEFTIFSCGLTLTLFSARPRKCHLWHSYRKCTICSKLAAVLVKATDERGSTKTDPPRRPISVSTCTHRGHRTLSLFFNKLLSQKCLKQISGLLSSVSMHRIA